MPASAELVIVTPRLTLRPMCGSDLAQFAKYVSASDAAFAEVLPAPPTSDVLLRFDMLVMRTSHGLSSGRELYLAAFARSGGELVGQCWLSDIEATPLASYTIPSASCTMGWAVRPDWQGRGLGYEMCAHLQQHAFAAPPFGLGMEHLRALILATNVRSVRLAERLGFAKTDEAPRQILIEGRMRAHDVYWCHLKTLGVQV